MKDTLLKENIITLEPKSYDNPDIKNWMVIISDSGYSSPEKQNLRVSLIVAYLKNKGFLESKEIYKICNDCCYLAEFRQAVEVLGGLYLAVEPILKKDYSAVASLLGAKKFDVIALKKFSDALFKETGAKACIGLSEMVDNIPFEKDFRLQEFSKFMHFQRIYVSKNPEILNLPAERFNFENIKQYELGRQYNYSSAGSPSGIAAGITRYIGLDIAVYAMNVSLFLERLDRQNIAKDMHSKIRWQIGAFNYFRCVEYACGITRMSRNYYYDVRACLDFVMHINNRDLFDLTRNLSLEIQQNFERYFHYVSMLFPGFCKPNDNSFRYKYTDTRDDKIDLAISSVLSKEAKKLFYGSKSLVLLPKDQIDPDKYEKYAAKFYKPRFELDKPVANDSSVSASNSHSFSYL